METENGTMKENEIAKGNIIQNESTVEVCRVHPHRGLFAERSMSLRKQVQSLKSYEHEVSNYKRYLCKPNNA